MDYVAEDLMMIWCRDCKQEYLIMTGEQGHCPECNSTEVEEI